MEGSSKEEELSLTLGITVTEVMMLRYYLPAILTVIALAAVFHITSCCNEAICASIVSKCMLTQSCNCDLKNCTCCKDCFNCLDYLYSECCSCVEMCPKPNNTRNELSRESHVEDLGDPIPELFDVLTEETDNLLRWLTFTFPIDIDITFKPKYHKDIKYKLVVTLQETGAPQDVITVNCTVAYMSQCMSWNKCKASCRSMGASSYRWFHDGCCECIGHTCINYGINESRCMECPDVDEEVETNVLSDGLHHEYVNYEYDEYDENKPKATLGSAGTEQMEALNVIGAAELLHEDGAEEEQGVQGATQTVVH